MALAGAADPVVQCASSMERPTRLGDGVRPIRRFARASPNRLVRAEADGSPLVVRFIELLHQDDYGGSIDVRARATDAVRALQELAGRIVPAGIVPWRSVQAPDAGYRVAAVRAYLSARLSDVYAESRKHPTAAACRAEGVVRRAGPRARHASRGSCQRSATGGAEQPVWFPGGGARCTQAELAHAYFGIRTGVPLFGRGVTESYYVAAVRGAEGAELGREPPGASYRLNLEHPGLQRPAAPSRVGHRAVISESELSLLRSRGFHVEIETGPHPSEATANNALDNMYESPFSSD